MSFAGDFALGSTIDVKFTTRRFSTGAPHQLAGTPVISAYPDNSTTQITAGITLTVDFDTVTGLNNVRVVATSGNGYAAGSSYFLVITTGTVDSVSVVGEVIGSFTLERGAAFGRLGAPSGASMSADIAAILTTQMTEAYAANGVAPTAAQALFAIHQLLMQFAISGTNLTVRKLDNSTTAFTVTLNDATSPTSAVRT